MCLPLQTELFKQLGKMKRIFRTLCGLLLASVALTSCLGDDDDNQTTTYSDVAITQFTLGTINRYTTTTSPTTGRDTLVKTTFAGSGYKMTIDQLGHQIYNRKALPVGSDVRHVVCTISTRNGGVVALQSMTSDSLSWFNANDSIDFSVPRTFRVYSIDGTSHRDYVVALTASSDQGLDFEWRQEAAATLTSPLSDHQVVSFRGQLLLFGSPTGFYDEPDAIYRSADGTAWERLEPNIPMKHYRGRVVVMGERLYVLTTEGLYSSADGETWQQIVATADPNQAGALKILIGGGTRELFALRLEPADPASEPMSPWRLVSSTDGGRTWTAEAADYDTDPCQTPTLTKFGCVAFDYMPTDSTDYVLLLGCDQAALEAGVITPWRKLSCYAQSDRGGQWVSMTLDDANRYQLPAAEVYGLEQYDGTLVALCGKQGQPVAIYESADQGITWKTQNDYSLPDGFARGPLSLTTSGDALWIVSPTGQTWKGTFR